MTLTHINLFWYLLTKYFSSPLFPCILFNVHKIQFYEVNFINFHNEEHAVFDVGGLAYSYNTMSSSTTVPTNDRLSFFFVDLVLFHFYIFNHKWIPWFHILTFMNSAIILAKKKDKNALISLSLLRDFLVLHIAFFFLTIKCSHFILYNITSSWEGEWLWLRRLKLLAQLAIQTKPNWENNTPLV